MAAQDLHTVPFEWPHPEPTTVIVTGTFDEWSCSVPLTKTPAGFVGMTKIPWGEKIKFKYVVDGKWLLHENQATETDPGGFVNHVYIAPPAPLAEEALPTTLSPEQAADTKVADSTEPVKDEEPATNGRIENDGVAATVPVEEAANGVAQAPAAEVAENAKRSMPDSEPTASVTYPAGYPQLLSDIADTIVARDGTSSTLDYMASGLGAAIHSVVGVDPINIQQIAIPTPKPDDAFSVPGGAESAPNSAAIPAESVPAPAVNPAEVPEVPKSPVAPIVPIVIVPVNAAENNTVAPTPPPELVPVEETVKEAVILEPVVPLADAPVEPVPVVVETPAPAEPPSVVTEETTAPAPATAPTALAVAEPIAETKVEDALNAEPSVAIVEPTADAKPEEASAAESEPASEHTIEETSAQEPVSTPVAADDFVAEVKGEAVALRADEVLAHIAKEPADEVKAQELVVPVAELVKEEEEPVATKVEEPVRVAAAEPEPVVEPTHVSEPTVTVELAVAPKEAPEEITAVVTELIIEEPPAKEEVPATVIEAVKEAETAPAASEPVKAEEPSVVEVAPTAVEPPTEVPQAIEEPVAAPQEAPAPAAAQPTTESEVKSEQATGTDALEVPAKTEPIVEAPAAPEPAPIVEPTATVEPVAVMEASAPPPIPIVAAASTDSTTAEKPASNGHAAAADSATPSKEKKVFPSASPETPTVSADNSPSSSKFNTMRKKRTSILGKLKHIFQSDKEKEKEKK